MARDNNIVLSDSELTKLQETRTAMFDSDEVPYGVVVDRLCDNWSENDG